MPVEAVIFDLDGVLVDSEQAWMEAKRRLTIESGGRWEAGAGSAMLGMSSTEWSRYMHQHLAVPILADDISSAVVARMTDLYSKRLPLVRGAQAAVERLARWWPLGLASSSNRPVIDLVLRLAGWGKLFKATVSSEEVVRGKPAPDVYLEAAELLGVDPRRSVAIEDSHNGVLSAKAAGLRVIAIPNPDFPPRGDALAAADRVLSSIDDLNESVVTDGAPP